MVGLNVWLRLTLTIGLGLNKDVQYTRFSRTLPVAYFVLKKMKPLPELPKFLFLARNGGGLSGRKNLWLMHRREEYGGLYDGHIQDWIELDSIKHESVCHC